MSARVELECAMAAIITSPTAKAHFEADAAEFAATFGLLDDDVARLRRMGPDLSALTGSFVSKRATTLRWSAKRTLALLGPAGNGVVQDYVDLHPATESLPDEAGRFTDFVVQWTDSGRDGSVRADVIADMARFERARSASFWGAVAGFEPAPATGAEVPGPDISNTKRLRLRPGANADSFDFDLRPIYHATTTAAELQLPRPDPCTLCFVHTASATGYRVLRLREAEVGLVRSLGASDHADTDAVTDGVVSRLVRGGVLEWV